MADDTERHVADGPLQVEVGDRGVALVASTGGRLIGFWLTPAQCLATAQQFFAAVFGPSRPPPEGRVARFEVEPPFTAGGDATFTIVMEDGRIIPLLLPIEYAPLLGSAAAKLVAEAPAAGSA